MADSKYKLLEYHKVDYLGVAFADEGISLKKGIQITYYGT
jgi:alanine racemase